MCTNFSAVTLCSMREQHYVVKVQFPPHSVKISFIFLASKNNNTQLVISSLGSTQ